MAKAARYSIPAMLFHWIAGGLMLTNVALAWTWDDIEQPTRGTLIFLHISIGLAVLMLFPFRLAWRLIRRPPPYSLALKRWEAGLAHAVHLGLYALMLGLPLTGWMLVSANKLSLIQPLEWFGLFPWPPIGAIAHLPPEQKQAWHEVFVASHVVLTKFLYVLFALHMAGILKRRFLDRAPVLPRMLPAGRVTGQF